MIESGNDRKPNRLVHSTSPYLLQHAYNPVNWFEWSGEALEKAKRENKPVLVSIGYSSCHWCHVMERESFENNDIAGIMNEHFVCIKVDREERPDIDQVYMDAVQALGIHGGWPLNVFLTPSQQPFYGGTYFPPGNWSRLLLQISKTFESKRKEIDESAGQILEHLNTSDLKRFAREEKSFDSSNFDSIFQALDQKYDSVWGGMEKAPKFVMPSIWRWLLRYHQVTKNEKARDMVVHTLSRLAMGGIYDQVGGGFSRYSVDREWFAPHFEKMLYDNAQLLSLFSEAFRVSQDPVFKRVVSETITFLEREMMHPEGGFYSALDADSEGMEGKFYTWTHADLNQVLGEHADAAFNYFGISEGGNWEHGRNILYLKDPAGLATDKEIIDIKEKLLEVRNKRIRPGLDDKILTGWNAMTIAGLIDCYNAFGEQRILELALNCMAFLEKELIDGPTCWRSFRGKRGTTEGFLEDYAFTIGAYTALYQATWEEKWLSKAERMCHHVVDHFWDSGEGYFFFTGSSAEKLIARKKEIFDNVIPSSNSVMARNLHYLGTLLDNGDWKQKAIRMATTLKTIIVSEPSYASNWATLALEITAPFAEIAIVGKEATALRKELTQKALFNGIVLGTQDSSSLPLLRDKSSIARTTIYVCFDKSCKKPVHTVNEALELLEQSNN